MGWGQLFGKLSTFIPSRVEQMKNERKRLIDEQKEIMSKPANDVSALRSIAIDKRVSEIDSILGNKASD
jgi:uncharacterized protein (UPF0335 family)